MEGKMHLWKHDFIRYGYGYDDQIMDTCIRIRLDLPNDNVVSKHQNVAVERADDEHFV